MKYTIEAIENAKPGMRWEEIGCHWTLGQAYLYSKENASRTQHRQRRC